MRITLMKLRAGVSFVQFGSTWGGNIQFGEQRVGPGTHVRDVTATARPDLGGVFMETTRLNKFTNKTYNPYVVPFESIDGFEVDQDSVPQNATAPDKTEEVGAPPEPTPEPEKRKPGRPPKVAAAIALIAALISAPAFAADASTEPAVPARSTALANIRCVDGPKPGCVTCANMKTEQFQIVCGLPVAKKAKK